MFINSKKKPTKIVQKKKKKLIATKIFDSKR